MPQELLREMVEQYGNAIYRLALRYTGDSFLAEDIAQETFLRACAKLQSYDRSRPTGPWLFRIALNLCRNRWRAAREIPTDERVTAAEADPGPGPEHIYLQRETEQELAGALRALPPIYREVLSLKHVNELSYAEIRAVLGLNLSLVKNRLYRGRIMLREALQKGEYIR
ncbi:MAG TPA: sigma-70 family RNA polymerase sigma factor [Firmicutes bacterium]|nr:sigma-70 family RNA polymerase sigma factor [Bacillota bacterium]